MANYKKKKISKKRRILSILGWVCLAAIIIGLVLTLSVAGFFYYLSMDLPAIGPLLKGYEPPETTRIYSEDNVVIGELFEERRTVASLSEIPQVMIDAVIAAEDSEFRNHKGIDYRGVIRATLANLRQRGISQGASTITQQVARGFYLSRQKTFTRKIKEILLTRKIEAELSKDEILFLYLNQINFGHARYGVAEAARFYFNKDIGEINIQEAALLAGIPKGPAVYEPIRHPKNALSRRRYVINEMQKNGFIAPQQAKLAHNSPLEIFNETGSRAQFEAEIVPAVIEELSSVISLEELRKKKYTIYTSLDYQLQQETRKALINGLMEVDKRHTRVAPFKPRKLPPGADSGNKGLREGRVYYAKVTGHDDEKNEIIVDIGGLEGRIDIKNSYRYNPKELPPSKMAQKGAILRVKLAGAVTDNKPVELELAIGPQGAVVVMDPETGYVRAMVGGDRVKPGGFNRAAFGVRQPGSVFKPFVFLEAIRSREFTPSSFVDDSPEIDGDWRPSNASDKGHRGQVTLREALADSLNLPAIKLIRAVTPQSVVELANLMGIDSVLEPNVSLALGTSGVTPLELACAYSTMASGGIRRGPWLVKKVVDSNGREISLMGRSGRVVISQEEAYMITSMLESVINGGTGSRARSLKIPLAGKTGTTDKAVDAWFAGFSSKAVATVWVGYDEPRTLGRREYGARAALPIWIDVMRNVHQGLKPESFEMPEGVLTVKIDPLSGLLAYEEMENAVTEVFIAGTEPTQEALPPDVIGIDNFLLQQLEDVEEEVDADNDSVIDSDFDNNQENLNESLTQNGDN